MKDEMSRISLNGTVYNFAVDHGSIEKEDILDIYEHLTKKNNKNQCYESVYCIIKF